MRFRLLLLLVILSTVPLALNSCSRHQDRFSSDTEKGLIGFAEPRVIQGDPDRLVNIALREGPSGELEGIRRLNHELKLGDEVVVGISVGVTGEYRAGGGWIFRGRKYYGRYGLAGDLLSVESSQPHVLAASGDEFGNLRLKALAVGQSRLTLTTTISRRYADRPEDSPIQRDSVTIDVSR